MNLLFWRRRRLSLSLVPWSAPLLCLVLAAGCGRNDIRVYRVPKERTTEAAWQLPPNWEERQAGGMRAARFAVPGKEGQELDVSIIPLKDVAASRSDVVNLWREQIRLGPASPQDLETLAEKVTIGSGQGELFDMASAEAIMDGKAKARILVAMAKDGKTTWFVKMTGEDESVSRQKATFTSFLKTLNFEALSTPAAPPGHVHTPTGNESAPVQAGAGSDAGSNAKPQWTIPAGWQEQPATQMLLAKFLVASQQDARVEMTVSALPGPAGGLLANVNRWRDQLKVDRVTEGELNKLATPLDLPGGKAMLVDMNGTDARTGQPARIIGAIMEHDGTTWFYKLMGNDPLAAREKEAFLKFLQTIKYPNG